MWLIWWMRGAGCVGACRLKAFRCSASSLGILAPSPSSPQLRKGKSGQVPSRWETCMHAFSQSSSQNQSVSHSVHSPIGGISTNQQGAWCTVFNRTKRVWQTFYLWNSRDLWCTSMHGHSKGLCDCADMKVRKQSALLSSVWVCLLDAVIAGLSGTVNRVQAFWGNWLERGVVCNIFRQAFLCKPQALMLPCSHLEWQSAYWHACSLTNILCHVLLCFAISQ